MRLWNIGVCFVLLGVPQTVHAYEAQVNASVDAQFYTLRSPYGDPIVRRRRYTQTLGVTVYGLGGDVVSDAPRLSFRARMRLDADLGQEGRERNPDDAARYVPGLEQAPLDLMYAYLEGQDYFGGFVDFRVGRQYTSDALGFWSFDGALVGVTTPIFVRAEAFGGFEQRGGLPLSTPRWEADGVYRGDRSDLEFNQWPSFLNQERLAPAYGFALESAGVHWLATRLAYRKVISRDTVLVSPFADAGGGFTTVSGARVASERLGYAARVNDSRVGGVSGHVMYDFYKQTVSEYLAALDWYTTEDLTLGAQYEYYLPTYDADSIWNWFSQQGMTTALARVALDITRNLDVTASGGIRIFETEGDADNYANDADRTESGKLADGLFSATARYGWASGGVSLRGMGEAGERGHRTGADLTTTQRFGGGFYDTLLILSLYDWEDALRPERDATSFSYVLGGGVNPFEQTRLGLEWEHDMNRLVGQRYRVLATLDFTVLD
ncbi:MAG TPA: hypothetical protein VK524_22155 [Polyangiaceae bacterium]|nr:hypothetical protein [Polyangiaceae bacterium]